MKLLTFARAHRSTGAAPWNLANMHIRHVETRAFAFSPFPLWPMSQLAIHVMAFNLYYCRLPRWSKNK